MTVVIKVCGWCILTEQRNWDFKIAADLQEWSKIKICVDINIIQDILQASTQNGKEVVTHITHMLYGRKEGSFTASHIY